MLASAIGGVPTGTFYINNPTPGSYYYIYHYFNTHNYGGDNIEDSCSVTIPIPKLSTPNPIITKESITSAKVSWDSVSGASSYKVEYGSTSDCLQSATVYSTSYSITGLTEGFTCYAKVTAIGNGTSNQDSDPSSVVSVSLITPLQAPSPSVSSPSLTSLKVSWSSISNATSYIIEYAKNSSFSSVSSTTTTSRSTTISGLSAGTTYYFRVKATTTTAGYSNSAWSSTVSGTTTSIIILSPPTPSVAANSQTQITISWSGVSHASSYTVAYGTTSACSSGSFTVTGTSKSITGLSANTTYYVKVMVNTSEVGYTSSSYSSVKSITTPKIVLGTPVFNTISVTNSNVLVIEFDKVSNANQYIIEYATSSDFSNKKTMTII